MTDPAILPSGLQAAWGYRERPTKGPKPTLTADRIVAAAVRLAQTDGFAAVSMSRVAGELSTSAMALYRHVANKDELTLLMMEAAVGSPPASKADGETWRAALERWAGAMLAMFREHPWFLQVPVAGPPATPRQLAWLESGLFALDGTRLTEAQKLSMMMLLLGYVRNEATLRGQMAAAAGSEGRSVEASLSEFGALMRLLVQPDRFPMLRQVIDAGAMDQADDPEAAFAFGVARILDGVEAFIAGQGAAATSPERSPGSAGPS